MADLEGDSASMMGSFDPSAFTGRDEDLFLPGDSLFGFSASAGMGSNPDVGGGSGDSDASFQGGSASMLFPPSAASFQAMASLPPEPDSTAISAAGAVPSRGVSSSRRDVVGSAGGGAGAGAGGSGGSKEGEVKSPLVPPPVRKSPSLKQSLDAAIVSATARDAANAAAAAATAGSTAAAGMEKAAAKPKSSARPRRRSSGGGGRGRGGGRGGVSNKPKASGGSSVDAGAGAGAGASGTPRVDAARRPARNLRRPRQESNKKSELAAATAAAPGVPSLSGDVLGSSRRGEAASNPMRGGAAKQAQSTTATTSAAAAGTADDGGPSGGGTSTASARPQRGGSPCRPPPRRTSLQASPADKGGKGDQGTEMGLPAGMELIPGFEDTIDSHFMTALLQKSPGAQSGDPVSAFASADGHGLETPGGGRGDGSSGGGGIDFGVDPNGSLGFTAGLLLGSDTQPGAAPATAGTADAANQGHSTRALAQAPPKARGNGAALPNLGGVPRASTARRESGVAAPSPPAKARTDGATTAVAAPPSLSSLPTTESCGLVSSTTAAVAAPVVPFSPRVTLSTRPLPGAPAAIGSTATVSAPLGATGSLTTATGACATKCDNGTKLPERRANDPPRITIGQEQQQPEANTKTPPAAASAESATPSRQAQKTAKAAEGEGETRSPPASAEPSPANGASDEVQVDVGTEHPAPAGPAFAQPASLGMRIPTTYGQPQAMLMTGPPRPLLLPRPPPPPLMMFPGGAFQHAFAPVATAGVGGGGFSFPTAPLAVRTPAPAPSRPLPRKVSLRFSPRDASSEEKLSKHGYIPFQKLTAPLWKPLEAVFKFMKKKWSDVPHSDLDNIRIIFDVTEADRPYVSAAASSPSAPWATIVWSAEQSSKPLVDLVSALPHSTLERVRAEEALSLTYTFATGPVGPPPSHGSAPWDTPRGRPATATGNPRPPPLPTEKQPATQRDVAASSSSTFRSPVVAVSGSQADAGEPVAVRHLGSPAAGSSSAAPAAGRTAPRAAGASGPKEVRKKRKAAGGAAAGGAGGSATSGKMRRASRAAVPADASSALKKHYKNVTRMFKRQGVSSPPVAHFMPGGLFAKMHDAIAAGGAPGAPVVTRPVPATVGLSAGPSAEARNSAAGGKAKAEKDNDTPPDAGDLTAGTFDEGLDASDDGGGFEDFGGDANGEDERGGAGDGAGGALMGEETCMALFGESGVELMVDTPQPSTKTGKQDDGVDNGVAKPVVRKDPPPTTYDVEASAPSSPPPPAQSVPETRGVVASPAAAVAAGQKAEASTDPALPLTQPPPVDKGAMEEARSAGPLASSPHDNCALVGEDTCMALFGGEGVELLVDPPPSQSQAGDATGMREGGAEGLAGIVAAETAPRPAGGELGRQVQPESPLSLGKPAANEEVTTKPASSPAGDDDVAAAGPSVQAAAASGAAADTEQQSTTLPEADAASAAESKRATPSTSPLRTAGSPRAGLAGAPPVAGSAQVAPSPPAVADVVKGMSFGPTNGGTTVASEVREDVVTVASDARPGERQLDSGEADSRTVSAATLAAEQPPPPPSSGPPPLIRVGKLPSCARRGCLPSPALASAATSVASCAMDAKAHEKVTPARGVVPETAGGCKDAGGGVAVTMTSPPCPPSVHSAAGTTGVAVAAVGAEDEVLPQTGGTRKLTRSHSNGGDPALRGSSGGGCSSPPEGEGGWISKRGEGAPSGPTPPQAGGVPEKSGTKRWRCRGSGKGTREGSERKRIAPTMQSSGGPPQRASSPVFDAPAVTVPPTAPAAPAPATTTPRTFAFASSKRGDVEASAKGPPPPPPTVSLLDGGGGAAAVMSAGPEPGNAGACATSVPRVAEACGGAVRGGVGKAAVPAVDGSPDVRTPGAASSVTKARPFAFAAAAQKGGRGELLRPGASRPTTAAAAAGKAAASPSQSDLPAPAPSVQVTSPQPTSASERSGEAAEGVASTPLPAPVRNNVSASLSLSMSPEEVQAGYSEAWSSLPSCFWDESALVAGGGGADGGVKGSQLASEGPVTRWLALPHAGPTLGGTTDVPASASASPAPASSSSSSSASPVAAPSRDGHRGDGGKKTGAAAALPRGGAPAVELTQRDAKESRWASFCTAFATSRGSSGGASAGAATATAAVVAAAPSTRATEETRSLPTLIRLGRSMTKGVAPVEKDHSTGEGRGSAAANGKEPPAAYGEAEAAGAPASAPARASLVAQRPVGSSCAGPAAGGKGGGGSDTAASDGLGGTRRKRVDGDGASDDGATGGGETGGGKEAAAATALPKKRAKKKGRIAPVFVSVLPPDSFGTLARSFSSNRRA
eukprot:g10570.t1